MRYADLRPAISIFFPTELLFRERGAGKLPFVLYDPTNELVFGGQLPLHVAELRKYHLEEKSI